MSQLIHENVIKNKQNLQKAFAIATWLRVAMSGKVKKTDPMSVKMSIKVGSSVIVSVLEVEKERWKIRRDLSHC
jgi:hypothetical protein